MGPVFTPLAEGSWMPAPHARGPFDGVQGGAVAALMATAIEGTAAGFVASVTTHFLRPAPLAPLYVTVRPVRVGRRVGVIDAELATAEGTVAVQRATVIAPRTDADLPNPPRCAAHPEALPAQVRAAPHGRAWLMDTMDVRIGPDGRLWFRQRIPLLEPMTGLARVLAAADWAHGLVVPIGAEVPPPAAIPNADLAVHLIRPPSGPWVGLEAATAWSDLSIGTGWAMLYDTEGLLGRVAMSVAVARLAERAA